MPADLLPTHPLWLAAAAALLPALLGSWWTRSRPGDPAVLAEWNHAVGQRLSVTALLCTVAIFALTGQGGWWLLGVELVGLAAIRHRMRRALHDESWSFWSYLSWQVRLYAAAIGFWIFIALAPARVGGASPDTAWGWALGCMVVGVLWLHFHRAVVLRLLGARSLERPDLERPFLAVFEQATILRPSVWRAGVRGGVLANALALPSLHGHGVLFFDTLLERLTPEETTAILAHEVAHLEHFDTRLRRMHAASVAATVGVLLVAASIATRLPDLRWLMTGLWPLLVLGALYLRRSRMQAHETSSDRRAVELCGNAEALVTGLGRLYAINHVPRRLATGTEETATHPSLARRIRDIRAHAGPVEPARLDAPTVVASSDAGRFVIFDASGVSFAWSDADAAASEETIRSRAGRIESTAYADLTELRLATSHGRVVLTAVDRQERRTTFPVPSPEAARVQAVLDVVDQQVSSARPGTALVADRMIAGLVLGLGATLTGFAGLVPAVLTLVRPSRRLLTALAAALLGASLIALTRGLAGQVVALVLLPVALAVTWRARRGDTRPVSPRWSQVEAAGLALPVVAGGVVALAGGGHLYDLHEQLREHVWITSSVVALAAYLGASPERASRRLAGVAAAAGSAALWCASPWFAAAVGADPLIVAGPVLRERAMAIRPIGSVQVDGEFWSVRLARSGSHFLLTDGADRYEDESGLVPRAFVVGSLDGWTRTVRAIDAWLVGDTGLLVLEHARGASELRLERPGSAETLWAVTVPEMLATTITVSPGGRWRLVQERPDGVSWIEGRLDGTVLERRTWTLDSTAPAVPIAYYVGDTSAALAVDLDRAIGPLPWASWSGHSRTALVVDAAGASETLAVSHLLVDCLGVPPDSSGPLVCTAYDGRETHVWSLDADRRRLVAVGRWRGYLSGRAHDGPQAIDVDANGLPARLDPASATLDVMHIGDGDCPVVTGHALAGRRFAALCARESATEVTLYELPD